MAIRIDGTNTTANPGITGADADTGLQLGTDEVIAAYQASIAEASE